MDSDHVHFQSIKNADEARNAFIEVRDPPDDFQSATLLQGIPADSGPQDLLARVKALTAERDEIDKKREMAEYTYSKYADDLRVARAEASKLQRDMVSPGSVAKPKLTSSEDYDAFVMVLVDGDGMPVSSAFPFLGYQASTSRDNLWITGLVPDLRIVLGRSCSERS
jgi:hypothetical protein